MCVYILYLWICLTSTLILMASLLIYFNLDCFISFKLAVVNVRFLIEFYFVGLILRLDCRSCGFSPN